MAFSAFFILGIITYMNIPVSLLPDIAIPEITVQVTAENTSARELENVAVAGIRQQVMQVGKLRNIRSETRDGSAIIRMSFEYGTNIGLAYIEVNEKVDAAMNSIPKEIDRPKVIKASVSDIPVLNLNMTLKPTDSSFKTEEERFIEMSEFAEAVIRHRIEQLSQVAMVDVSGLVKKQIIIVPNKRIMETSGITFDDIESAVIENNVEPGNIVVHEVHHEYYIRFSNIMRTVDDINNIFLKKNDRIYRLKDIAKVNIAPEKEKGMVFYNGKRAIVFSIIKQSEENVNNMQATLQEMIEQLHDDYPEIVFNISQNQTELLNYTISNLRQNLVLAFIFICLVSVIFMKNIRLPLIIGFSMFVSLIISLLFFYVFKISLNAVSITGLILALGMMIDNSIIVTENIEQYRHRGNTLDDACVEGTNEIIAPMLSSSLTTIVIFIPLIFLSGIAGSIFFDQAFSITAGLFVSYITGIILLPVLYKTIYSIRLKKGKHNKEKYDNNMKPSLAEQIYHRSINYIFSHKFMTVTVMLGIVSLCFWLFKIIPKEKMPDINQNELLINIEWNEGIHVTENSNRTLAFVNVFLPEVQEISALVAQQQFLLRGEKNMTSDETEIYVKVRSPKDIPVLKNSAEKYFREHYPYASITFTPAGTIFEKIFVTGESGLVVEYYLKNKIPDMETIRKTEQNITDKTGEIPNRISFRKQLHLSIDREKLLLYDISYHSVYKALRTAFKEYRFATLRSYEQYLPIILGEDNKSVNETINNTFIDAPDNDDGSRNRLPLSAFVSVTPSEDLKLITAGKAGEYIPFVFDETENAEQIIENVRKDAVVNNVDAEVGFSGTYFSNRKMINEFIVILLISITLMYFILAAQFESFTQPLIVLMEIPVDITASLFLLYVTGHSLNLMSAIGIVVSCGIIINDSILKVDVMNQLRKSGLPVMETIHEAGRRRLKAILMTSLTTIVCMAPLFFSSDMGSELEKPLAIAMTGGMIIGTPVSLFVVPLVYKWMYGRKT
jgi:multidrug efflux pump subunit AcrB